MIFPSSRRHVGLVTASLLTSLSVILAGTWGVSENRSKPTSKASVEPSASNLSSLCSITNSGIQSQTYTDKEPNFFFRAFPNGRYVAFAAGGVRAFGRYLGGGTHYILDLSTGETRAISGENFDPVNMGDDILTAPSGGLKFYSVQKLLEGDAEHALIFRDPKMSGQYQSIGEVSRSGAISRYRAIIDQNTFYIQDYIVDRSLTLPKVSKAADADLMPVCRNIQFKLPMISKDGRFVAGLDLKTKVTKVWKLYYPKSDYCEEVPEMSPGVATGKIDFSYDSNPKLTFHMSSNKGTDGKWMSRPDKKNVIDVFIFDPTTKTMKKVTNNTSGNSWYPNFLPDGRVVYSDVDIQGRQSFVVADPSMVPAMAWGPGASQQRHRPEDVMLGRLYFRACAPQMDSAISVDLAAATSRALMGSQCQRLVMDHFATHATWLVSSSEQQGGKKAGLKKEQFAALTAAQLITHCPKQERHDVAVVGNTAVSTSPQMTAPELFQMKCALCHLEGSHIIPFDQPAKLKSEGWAGKIREVLSLPEDDPRRMPRGLALGDSDRAAILNFLAGP